LGEVVSADDSVALNGRSFTDLLLFQPGIVPMTTQLPDSIVMAGAAVLPPSGARMRQSIHFCRREDANGSVNGDVKELMNGGTTIVPNLTHRRVPIPTDTGRRVRNYSGGVVNVSPNPEPTSCMAPRSSSCATRI
jgi:hypothetical protein